MERLFELEADTMGEDWLLALQDELTKPYFGTVSMRPQGSERSWLMDKLKEFILTEQRKGKVFPPGEERLWTHPTRNELMRSRRHIFLVSSLSPEGYKSGHCRYVGRPALAARRHTHVAGQDPYHVR